MSDLPKVDVTGQKWGRLTAVRFVEWRTFPCGKRQQVWLWKCDCGNEGEAFLPNVKIGHTKSCGCFHDESAKTNSLRHGDGRKGKRHPLYSIWSGMKQRCEDSNCRRYARYGGRGIRVLWNSYEDFKKDMEATYRPGLSIERNDNDGHYCKSNCRWATAQEQAFNTSRTRWVEFEGEKLPLGIWATRLGMARHTLASRLETPGWTVKDALTRPIVRRKR